MGGAGRAVNRALGLNQGGTINRALGGSTGVAVAIGVVAAIALPFAVPAIASVIGTSLAVSPLVASTLAGGLYGAATGALAGSMTGNVGRGALIGGAGGAVGGFAQGGGFTEVGNALFGPTTPAATTVGASGYQGAEAIGSAAGYQGATGPALGISEAITPGVAISPGGTEGVIANAGYGAAPGAVTTGIGSASPNLNVASSGYQGAEAAGSAAGVGTPTTVAGAGAGAGTTTAAGGAAAPQGTQFERFLGGVTGGKAPLDLTTAEGVGRAISPIFSPSTVAGVGQLAMTMFNKPPESLTPQERSYVSETAELAGTNRALFEQRVNSARRLLQQGTPNPEEAYAQASMGVQRRFREAGLRDAGDVRRGLIEGARLGAAAIPGEYTRAASLTQAGLSAMPSTAPQGAEGMALPVYRDLERRQREYQADLGRGFGTLAGGRSRGGLFG